MMLQLDKQFIRTSVAESLAIYFRGQRLYEAGAYHCIEADPETGRFNYEVDGSYGDYLVNVTIGDAAVDYSCTCPYPGNGCKHVVAALFDSMDRIEQWRPAELLETPPPAADILSPEEIRAQALDDRRLRAKTESFEITLGDLYKGEHLLETQQKRQYVVTLHDPKAGSGHCSCPDFNNNRLGTCKHLIHLTNHLRKRDDFEIRAQQEKFPFVDIYWDSTASKPRLFVESPAAGTASLLHAIGDQFGPDGLFLPEDLTRFVPLLSRLDGNKSVRIRDEVLKRLDQALMDQEIERLQATELPPLDAIKTCLYPYQLEGVRFALYRRAALIGDEMGLGKTLQAIVLGILKRQIFGFQRILVITLASLKEQWKREIEKFTSEQAVVVGGTPRQRDHLYQHDPSLFKITNYEAVLRDVTRVTRFKPDLLILDEAQRIKNFTTKTADTVKRLPRKHALVLTGTPLENRLEDIYSIIQFLDPHLLTPLWQFAADHFKLSRAKKNHILGYHNLDLLHQKLKPIVIRRRKEEVLKDLPAEVTNNYYLDLTSEQAEIHAGYAQLLGPLLNKKILTPLDMKRIQVLLLKMRQVCDSTYLIDRNTLISPKLKELEGILDELIIQNGRKAVIFSEWTTMTYLIGKHLSRASIPFVELSGKVPVTKRQALIDEFSSNPDCRVFLSTDAGGTGLNLQAADCVINFELPWNPAKLRQRVGRVHRIGQKSQSVNVVNLITKQSIEERIFAGIQLKTELFTAVFDGGADSVDFSREKRNQALEELRLMLGEEPFGATGVEPTISEEIPEDTPHFLNPLVLGASAQAGEERDVDEAGEIDVATAAAAEDAAAVAGLEPDQRADRQAPEKVEQVLNSGIDFLSGLFEMATGKKLERSEETDSFVTVDRATGEVTLKFKLPTFA